MTKLIIQIPCYNEELTLPATLADLPRKLPGIDQIEWLIIDDGSTDRTVEVAHECGVDHVVCLPGHQGLARGFMAGLNACLSRGADVIVNTDADNQYCAADIANLVEPILWREADIVIGARPISTIATFSPLKKMLQRLGSWTVRLASGTRVPDAPSGFRAFSRNAARRLNVFNDYTYTLETIIQAGQAGIRITSVPIRTNDQTRESRLIRSIPRYVFRSATIIVRSFITYRPFRAFAVPGVCSMSLGLLLSLRYLWFFFTTGGAGHIQSLILTALLIGIGFALVVVGLVADLIAVNRCLLEKLNERAQLSDQLGAVRVGPSRLSSGVPTSYEINR
jgi:glycosyltransferase involved in cell wall biosynthesis